TVDYMAPEQAMNTHSADARADIYSLGCTLYRVLTGENTYGGTTLVEKIFAHREQPIPSLSAARPELPAAVDDVFRRMMAKRPEDRYQTMAEVVAALEACQAAVASGVAAIAARGPSAAELTFPTVQSGTRPLPKIFAPDVTVNRTTDQ